MNWIDFTHFPHENPEINSKYQNRYKTGPKLKRDPDNFEITYFIYITYWTS